jgi:uncharacterized Tic20 family protein
MSTRRCEQFEIGTAVAISFGRRAKALEAVTQREKSWAIACHLSAIIGRLLIFRNVIGPLFVWLFKRNESRRLSLEGRSALNLQLTITVLRIILSVPILLGATAYREDAAAVNLYSVKI